MERCGTRLARAGEGGRGSAVSASEAFLGELVVLCEKYGAALFPRTDGLRPILCVQVGDVWLDLTRVDWERAEPFTHG